MKRKFLDRKNYILKRKNSISKAGYLQILQISMDAAILEMTYGRRGLGTSIID